LKVSIITVARNSSRTIEDTLRSVSVQTYPDIEHIIIDGASEDETLKIVDKNSQRVAKVISGPDRGIYDAMNKGLNLASGEYVGYLNADDVYASEGSIAQVVDALRTNPVDLIYGDIQLVRVDDLESVVRYWRSGRYAISSLRTGWMPPHPGTFIRRDLMQEVGGFDTRYRVAGDYDLIVRCLLSENVQVSYLPKLLTKQRMGGASNRSMKALMLKSSEDLKVIRRNQIGGLMTLCCKSTRKIIQFFW
jgi:glycosyltransferase